MYAWRSFAALLVTLAAASAGWGQTALTEVVKPGDCFRYDISMKLTGEMRFRKDSGVVPVKLLASATHSYPERVLMASGSVVEKAARVYESAKVTIARGTDRSESTLRANRKLIVAEWQKGQRLVYSPAGALMRTESTRWPSRVSFPARPSRWARRGSSRTWRPRRCVASRA